LGSNTLRHGLPRETFSKALDASMPPLLGVVALYVGSLFQRRSGFIDNLRKEWVEIVEAKTNLIMFCKSPSHGAKEAIEAWGRLSVVIDRMRVIYRNVHESKSRLGLYPYEPLHDMRKLWEEKILQCITKLAEYDEQYYQSVEDDITESFRAIREVFIDELDLEAPTDPIIERGARRRKKEGAEPIPKERKRFLV
jgi:hypothetical protein